MKGKTELGKSTIAVVDLNNRQHFANSRIEIGERIKDSLQLLLKLLNQYKNTISTDKKKQDTILGHLKKLMQEAIPKAAYSATTATVMLNEKSYTETKFILQGKKLWSEELQDLENQMEYCRLDVR